MLWFDLPQRPDLCCSWTQLASYQVDLRAQGRIREEAEKGAAKEGPGRRALVGGLQGILRNRQGILFGPSLVAR